MFRFARSNYCNCHAMPGVAPSVSASTVQYLGFYFGSEIAGDTIKWTEIVFPQAVGCVSGVGSFGGLFDCSTTLLGGATNSAEEVTITGSLGDGTFNAGAWAINADSGLLSPLFLVMSGPGVELTSSSWTV